MVLQTEQELGAASDAARLRPSVLQALAESLGHDEPDAREVRVRDHLVSMLLQYEPTTLPSRIIVYSLNGREFPHGYCVLCGKEATPEHLESSLHRQSADTMMWADFLAGAAHSTRHRSLGRINRGMPHLPTQHHALLYWGEALPYFHQAGLRRLQDSQGLLADGPRGKPVAVCSDRLTAELGLVCYSGSGKYNRNDFWYWDEMPDSLTTLEDSSREPTALGPAQLVRSTSRRTGPDPRRPGPRPLHTMTPAAEQQAGWWPVLVLSLPDDLMDRLRPAATLGYRMILLCCFYQVMDVTHHAWWNEIPIWP